MATEKGGRGKDSSRAKVQALREEGLGSPAIRQRMKSQFSSSRLSQLMKETRALGACEVEADTKRNDAAGDDSDEPPELSAGDDSDGAPELRESSDDEPPPKRRAAAVARKRPAAARAKAAAGAEAGAAIGAGAVGPARPDLDVHFAADGDLGQAADAVLGHAAAIAAYLREHAVAGDGNCLFRAAAAQMPGQVERRQKDLRQEAVTEVLAHPRRYLPFTPGGLASLQQWARGMGRASTWGDELVCRALPHVLHRPVVVWRKLDTTQPPSCFVADDVAHHPVARPVYLLLDESNPGSEHYSALLPSNGPPVAPLRRLFPLVGARRGAASKARAARASAKPAAASAPAISDFAGLFDAIGKSLEEHQAEHAAGDADESIDEDGLDAGASEPRGEHAEERPFKSQLSINAVGPWAKPASLTPGLLQKCLDELQSRTALELRCEYGIPIGTLRNWRSNPQGIRDSLNRHLKALDMAKDGKNYREIAEQCKVGVYFAKHAAREFPAAKASWHH
jgi:hypothetical protein